MEQTRWYKVKELFAEAADLEPQAREAFLDSACDGDSELRAEIDSLLAESEAEEHLIEVHSVDLARRLSANGDNSKGRKIGHYTIIEELGRGGMGTVYLAERSDGEFKQRVALKLVRQTIADAETEKRFRREREILASLNHPFIAQLHDGGVSENGEPYFAMEYVDGKPLLEYADEHGLTTDERLALFLKVCSAVAYAHRNLTIHRDLKPSNILVAADGNPKLLDFGLAKILDENVGDQEQTATQYRAFTPAYASPEQILGKKVTTASDVYSLGVVLYELLTGEKPFHFEGKSLDELVQTLTDTEPLKPSSLNKTTADIEGDIDNIVLKCLQKEPERRYGSVEEFSADIERHRNGLPVTARPNTAAYLASRFFKRNKIAVSATALIIVALALGLTLAMWQASVARRESAKSDAVNEFLQKMLMTADPQSSVGGKKGLQATIIDILTEAERRLESGDLADQPDVRAELRYVVGSGYMAQGDYDSADRMLKQALAEQTAIFGPDSPRLVKTAMAVAGLFVIKADYANADRLYTQKESQMRDEYRRGAIDVSAYVGALSDYSLSRRAQGDSKHAEKLLREGLLISEAHGLESRSAFTRSLLTLILLDQGKFDEAESIQNAQIAKLQVAGTETAEYCAALTLLGSIQMEKGDLNNALANLQAAEKMYRNLYGPNHTPIFDNLRLQAQAEYLKGDYASANQKIALVLEKYRQNASEKYISFATALTVQGLILNKLDESAAAETVLRNALSLREANLPPGHFMTALTKGALGEVLADGRKFDVAESLLLESYGSLKANQANENLRVQMAKLRLAKLYTAWGRQDLAQNYR